MDALFICLAFCLVTLFAAAVIAMAWATGWVGGLGFAVLGAVLYVVTQQDTRTKHRAHDPGLNAFQQPLSRKR